MCLGIPARLVRVDEGHPDLARVDMAGVLRVVNIGLLEGDEVSLAPGDWLLVHMGFALATMSADEAREAMAALGAEQEAESRFIDALLEEST